MLCKVEPIDNCCRDLGGQAEQAFPFYPIQTMCEQATYCIESGNVHRLGELHRSLQYHKLRYEAYQYLFILDHLQNVLDLIKDESRKVNAMNKLNSD